MREAWRDFRWVEYRPFAWMMLAQLLFLFLACNLATPWGMAGAGWVLRSMGDPGIHYPTSFLLLSSAYARVESLIIALAGSFLIPLSIARVQAPMLEASAGGPDTSRRARRAYAVVLVGYLLNLVILIGGELLLPAGPHPWVASPLGGFKGEGLARVRGFLVAVGLAV